MSFNDITILYCRSFRPYTCVALVLCNRISFQSCYNDYVRIDNYEINRLLTQSDFFCANGLLTSFVKVRATEICVLCVSGSAMLSFLRILFLNPIVYLLG